jgi:hypothetical protein
LISVDCDQRRQKYHCALHNNPEEETEFIERGMRAIRSSHPSSISLHLNTQHSSFFIPFPTVQRVLVAGRWGSVYPYLDFGCRRGRYRLHQRVAADWVAVAVDRDRDAVVP